MSLSISESELYNDSNSDIEVDTPEDLTTDVPPEDPTTDVSPEDPTTDVPPEDPTTDVPPEDPTTDVLVSISSEIATWAVNHRIPTVSIHNLLDILRRHNLDVPKDPRTLLKTPRSVVTDNIANSTYIYLGVNQGIIRMLKLKNILVML